MTESVADAVIKPTYEQIVGSIKHSGVREILTHVQENEDRLNRELAYLEANEELTVEAKAHRADELIERYSPKISDGYRSAREKLETSVENSLRFSLPFPEGKTYAQAKVADSSEMLAVQGEAEAIAQRIAGTSLQEATKAASKNPRDRGIRERSGHTVDALRKEFDLAMGEGGVAGRIRAMAIERVCERMGVDLGQVVANHRTDVHYRALEDARRTERQLFALPSGKSQAQNPFSSKRRGPSAVGTYSSANKVMTGGRPNIFAKKKRRPAWK